MNFKAGVAANQDYGRDEASAIKALKKHKVHYKTNCLHTACPFMYMYHSYTYVCTCTSYVCVHIACSIAVHTFYSSCYSVFLYCGDGLGKGRHLLIILQYKFRKFDTQIHISTSNKYLAIHQRISHENILCSFLCVFTFLTILRICTLTTQVL